MKKHIHTLGAYIRAHKIITLIVILIVAYAGYRTVSAYLNPAGVTTYVAAAATRGTVMSTVTGTGQVSASNEVDIKSKASGSVVLVGVTNGQSIPAGTLIAQLDARTAEIDLENAKIALQKITRPGQNDTDTLTAVASVFVDIPSVIDGLRNALYGSNGFLTDQNLGNISQDLKTYRDQAGVNFDAAAKKYEVALAHYKAVNAATNSAAIANVAQETLDMVKTLALSVKDAKNTADAIQNNGTYSVAGIASFQTNVNSWSTRVGGSLSTISSATTNLANDPLDIASQQLSLKQKQFAYDDNFIRAPFDGVIAKLSVKKTDVISNGASIATLITKQKTASISLNEVDVAKIKIGDKVTLTFDAIDGLTITGEISEIDGVGTVSQGVVTYNVKISFDTQDDRVRSGMSVTANVITNVKPDVLTVPNAAIKTDANGSYVQIYTGTSTAPTNKSITTGISNDTVSEVTSGLTEGEKVVTRTVTASAATTQAPSILSAVGARGTGGNTTRATTR